MFGHAGHAPPLFFWTLICTTDGRTNSATAPKASDRALAVCWPSSGDLRRGRHRPQEARRAHKARPTPRSKRPMRLDFVSYSFDLLRCDTFRSFQSGPTPGPGETARASRADRTSPCIDASHLTQLLMPIGTDRLGRTGHERQTSSSRTACPMVLHCYARGYSEGWVRFLLLAMIASSPCDPAARVTSSLAASRWLSSSRQAAMPSPEYFIESRRIVDGSSDIFGRKSTVLDPRDMAPVDFRTARPRRWAPTICRSAGSCRRSWAAASMIRAVWGERFQVPRRLREAIRDPLPRLVLERVVDVRGRRLPEAPLPDRTTAWRWRRS